MLIALSQSCECNCSMHVLRHAHALHSGSPPKVLHSTSMVRYCTGNTRWLGKYLPTLPRHIGNPTWYLFLLFWIIIPVHTKSISLPPAPWRQPVVQSSQTHSEGDPQRAIRSLHEPHCRQFHHQPRLQRHFIVFAVSFPGMEALK